MAPKGRVRGVLMTATARKPRAEWAEDDSEDEVASDEEALAAKASQLEWDQIEREVREEKRRLFADREFTSGRRGVAAAAAYDDVADEFQEAGERPLPGSPDDDVDDDDDDVASADESDGVAGQARPGAGPAGAEASASSAEAGTGLPPSSVISAGRVQSQGEKRKRGGKKLAEQVRRRIEREAAEAAEAAGEETEEAKAKRLKKEAEEEEEAKKWLRLKLDGLEKPKRIKASRVVYYFDHDSAGTLFPKELPSVSTGSGASSSAAPAQAPAAAADGNFRASLRRDLFAEDSDEEQ